MRATLLIDIKNITNQEHAQSTCRIGTSYIPSVPPALLHLSCGTIFAPHACWFSAWTALEKPVCGAYHTIDVTKWVRLSNKLSAILDTLLHRPQPPFPIATNHAPTVGFNFATVRVDDMSFDVWDVGGQHRIRSLWRHYFNSMSNCIMSIQPHAGAFMELIAIFQICITFWPRFTGVSAVVFVVDSTDHSRFNEAKVELHRALCHPRLHGIPLLVFANKQDIDGGESWQTR